MGTRAANFAAGSYLTASVYLKKGTLNWVYLKIGDRYAWFNLNTGALGTMYEGGTTYVAINRSITHMGGGIYKCVFTVLTTGITTALLQIAGDTGDQQFWGTGGGTILFAGAQVEAKDHATSLMPTTAGPQTRVADTLRIDSDQIAGLTFAAGEGTVMADVSLFQPANSTATTIVSIDDADASAATSDRVELSRTVSGAASFSVVTNGATQVSITGGSIPDTGPVRLTGAWKANDAAAFVNSGTLGTDTSVTVPSGLSRLVLGGRSATGSGVASGHYKRIRVYGKRLSAGAATRILSATQTGGA